MAFSHPHDIFNYTSGRWLYNEKKRLAGRHLPFNIPALLEAAARSVHQQKTDVKSFRKLAEGGFNRVFELTMRNGFQVIARLPYPSSQPKLLGTASEVATMELVRKHGVRAPTVYGCSTNTNHSVGSEYIFMEKMPGRCLGDIWYELSDKERVRLLGEIVTQEAKLFNIAFHTYGSIYNTADHPEYTGRADLETEAGRFCIGPDVSIKHWFGTRSQLDIRRGPAMTAQQVLEDGARKERAWLRTYGKSRFPFNREYCEMFDCEKVDPRKHDATLEDFLKVAPYLVPKEEWLNNECKISGIIDWQHTTVLPLFLHAGIPSSFQNYGDPDSEELKMPEYPSNLNELDEDERQRDLELHRRLWRF